MMPVPFREKKGAGGMMIFFAHPLSPEGANALIWILKPNARRFPLGKRRAREGCAGSL
jgi:hypothetical protein